MYDVWAFLLQTLTASGVAVLLLVIKAMFRDKLPPKWHFAVWGVLGLVLLIPAGIQGRYVLFNWRLPVEIIKSWCGDYTFTQVLFPVPVFRFSFPKTIGQWLFPGYLLGVAVHAIKYLAAYIRLRLVLRQGKEVSPETMARIRQIAFAQKVKPCKAVEVPGLPSAFVCGVFRPVLALPAGEKLDDKILLHELLHLRSADTVWSLVICLLRCIHWCNPLLVYCADQAGNDLEARCDQRVLEQLEGEARRDYGRILLSMSNERYAKTPGSTCVNNGGKSIRKRIEAIARFKRYPAGMELVSVCAIVILALSLAVGAQATEVYTPNHQLPAAISMDVALASARSTHCTTPAGAFDAYGKAILEQNGIYRAMCAPEAEQAQLAAELLHRNQTGVYPEWDPGLPAWPNAQSGYYVYNLTQAERNAYEGLLVIELNYPPDGQPEKDGMMYLAVQKLRVEKEQGRWVAIPLEEFRAVEAVEQRLEWCCDALPGTVYSGMASGIRADVKIQTVHTVDSTVQRESGNWLFGSSSYYDTAPKPNAAFSWSARWQSTACTHLGTEAERETIYQIGLSVAPVCSGEARPEKLAVPSGDYASGSGSHGEDWTSRKTEPGWGPEIQLGSGGSSGEGDVSDHAHPLYYIAHLYINGEKTVEMDLYLQAGGAQ